MSTMYVIVHGNSDIIYVISSVKHSGWVNSKNSMHKDFYNERNVYPIILWFVSSPFKLQIESQNPQDPTKLKEIQFDLEDVPASLLQ